MSKLFSEDDVKFFFAKAIEFAPSEETHTRMISDIEYRNYVMDTLYNSIFKLWIKNKGGEQ
jgi:hypothetical protein